MKRAIRLALIAGLAALLFGAAAATAQKTEQAKKIGKRMMCLCGCNQILSECNHVGCTVSAEMLGKLDQRVAANEPEESIVQAFIKEYGVKALAEPPRSGFGLLAWILPPVVTLAGLGVVWMFLQRLRQPKLTAAGTPGDAAFSAERLAALRRRADAESED